MGNTGLRQFWESAHSVFSPQIFQEISKEDDEEKLPEASHTYDQPSNIPGEPSSSTNSDENLPAKYWIVKEYTADANNDHFEDSEKNGSGNSEGLEIPRHRWIDAVYLCTKGSACVLLINIIIMVTAAVIARRKPNNPIFAPSVVIWEGSCDTVREWDTAIHVIINILSTCILAASNYCMQVLLAPTRDQVDSHHAQGKWLDIGSSSMRNLFAIGRDRLALWIILLVTATPFHLLYGTSYSDINVSFTNKAPRDLGPSNINDLTTPELEKCFTCQGSTQYDMHLNGEITRYGLNWSTIVKEITEGNYEEWDAQQCGSYNKDLAKMGYKAIVTLAEDLAVGDANGTIFGSYYSGILDSNVLGVSFFNQSNSDEHETTCHLPTITDFRSWTTVHNAGKQSSVDMIVKEYAFNKCLAIKAEQHCQLLYSPPICIVIALAATVKVLAMFLTSWLGHSSLPLLTVGDAVASFMSRPDPATKDMCWISDTHVRKGNWGNSSFHSLAAPHEITKKRFWIQAPTLVRWIPALLFYLLCALGIIAPIILARKMGQYGGLLPSTVHPGPFSSAFFDEYGILKINQSLTVLSTVVIANLPQMLAALSYYYFNAVLTSMLAAAEYSSYGVRRKPLRVSWPSKNSQQRSTYWLSVPYTYAIPLLGFYAVFHWLLSQSLYYLEIARYDVVGNRKDAQNAWETVSEHNLGFSPYPMYAAGGIWGAMGLALILLGLRRLQSAIPLAGSCSAAISAACHPPQEEPEDSADGPLKWGQVSSSLSTDPDSVEEAVGHCSFTSLDTVKPSFTKLYA